MAKIDVDKKKLKVSIIPPPDSSLVQVDDVFIAITEAYCPSGHALISPDNELFDDFPGIKVKTSDEKESGITYLSPFHGDETKKGKIDWKTAQKLTISCPECDIELTPVAKCHCHLDNQNDGSLLKMYTSSDLKDSHVLTICNVWGCRRSKTTDNWNIISEYLEGEITD